MYVIPTHNNVLDPRTKRVMPPEGAEVKEVTYWYRRLRDGDIVIASKPEPVVVKAQPSKGEPKL